MEKVAIKWKLGYGIGDFAFSLYWTIFMSYLFFFYTDVVKISAAAVGTLMLVARIWDSINDPLVGIIADRTNTRWGKLRPYLLWFSLPLAIICVLTFTVPNLSNTNKLIYAYASYLLLMTFYTLANIPYTALLGVMSSNSLERTGIASYKSVFSFLGGAVLNASLLPLAKALGQGNEVKGWQLAIACYSLVVVILLLLTFIFTKEQVKPVIEKKTDIWKEIGDIVRNRQWLILILFKFFFLVFYAMRSTVIIHYFKYYVGEHNFTLFNNSYSWGYEYIATVFTTAGSLFTILGVICTRFIVKHLGKIRTYVVALIVASLASLPFYFLSPHNLTHIFFFGMLASFAQGPIWNVLWPMYADTADYAEFRTKKRSTGLVFSATTFTGKLSWAFAAWLAGIILSHTGFVPDMEPSTGMLMGIKLQLSFIPCAFSILSLIIIYFYRLDDNTMKRIEKILSHRRNQ